MYCGIYKLRDRELSGLK